MEQTKQEPLGILLIDKPAGITSFQVVSRVRKLLGLKRVGHCGTLDPFATGLLPVVVGRATGAVAFMESYDKSYRLEAQLGHRTDTQDKDGTVTDCVPQGLIEELVRTGDLPHKLEAAADQWTGSILQIPPMYSAIKIEGKPLYRYARKGQTVEREPRPAQVSRLEPLQLYQREGQWLFQTALRVSKGTYIRSWVDSVGETLGTYATCTALRRIQCGPFVIDQAQGMEDLFQLFHQLDQSASKLAEKLEEQGILMSVETAFPNHPRLTLTEEETQALFQGRFLEIDPSRFSDTEGNRCLMFNRNRCVAMGKPADQEIPFDQCQRTAEGKVLVRSERIWVDIHDY